MCPQPLGVGMPAAVPQDPAAWHGRVRGDRRGCTHNKTLAMTWALADTPNAKRNQARALQMVQPRPGRWQ